MKTLLVSLCLFGSASVMAENTIKLACKLHHTQLAPTITRTQSGEDEIEYPRSPSFSPRVFLKGAYVHATAYVFYDRRIPGMVLHLVDSSTGEIVAQTSTYGSTATISHMPLEFAVDTFTCELSRGVR